MPVTTTVDFTTYRFGYEYDFLYFRRGFLGALIDLKYTNVDVSLESPIGNEFVSATAPVPTFGAPDARLLIVTDDVASAPRDESDKRRGVAGDLIVFNDTRLRYALLGRQQ